MENYFPFKEKVKRTSYDKSPRRQNRYLWSRDEKENLGDEVISRLGLH